MKQEVIFQNASSFVLPEGIRQKLHGNVLLITGTHARVNSFFDLPGISLSALSIPNGLLTTDVVDKCRAGVNDSPDVVIATGGGPDH